MMTLTGRGIYVCGIFSVCLVLLNCSPSVRYTRGKATNTDKKDIYSSTKHIGRENLGTGNITGSDLTRAINMYLGVPYKYGGMSKSGMDCSGFVTLIYRNVYNIELPRSSREQRRYGRRISIQRAKPGDLVFFRTGRFRRVNHVGIYVGANRFAHASLKHGVIYSSLTDEYYARRLSEVRRIF